MGFGGLVAGVGATTLRGFGVDLYTGYLRLDFSANVQSETLNASSIVLLANSTANVGDEKYYRLKGYIDGIYAYTNTSASVIVTLLQTDYLEILRRRRSMFSSAYTSYLQLDGGTVRGVSPNILSFAAGPMMASDYTADSYPPSLIEYRLDMNVSRVASL